MVTMEAGHSDGPAKPIARRVRRRDELEPLSLIAGFLGLLFVLALTVSATPRP